MIKKIIYYLRLFCCVLYLIMTLFMLKYIYQCGIIGIIFLVVTSLFIISMLVSLLSQKKAYQEIISYNLLIIALTGYFGIISYRLLLDYHLSLSMLYAVNIEYCKINFLILSIVSIGVVISTIILYHLEENEKKKL